jgi:putative OPT family oligopeptide transporter
MTAGQIWDRYIRYIGAGAVATAGIITLIKSIPTMVESFKLGVGQISKRVGAVKDAVERTDHDLGFDKVGIFLALILLTLTLVPGLLGYLDSVVVRGIAALCIGVFAFFFVTVSSRIVGLVGVTSNPTSGMTIATLLGTSLVFYLMGWTDMAGKATALMVGTAVCIAASIAGDTSQDLKTGFILGATPYKQQIGELIGVITSAGFVCLVIIVLNQGTPGGLGGEELPAPQAVLMKLVIDGVLDQNLPWALIGIGVGIAGVAALFKIPTLAFAVGVYLPLSTMGAVFFGGLLRWFLGRRQAPEIKEERREKGVLFGSGLVGGGGLTGVVLAVWVVAVRRGEPIAGFPPDIPDWASMVLAAATIVLILGIMGYYATRRDT